MVYLESEMEGVIEEYRRSLQELSVNSKPLIDMLTILAQENDQYADRIVSLIETRLHEVTIFIYFLYSCTKAYYLD